MISIALKFIPGEDAAPKVIASGDGFLGNRITEIAKLNNISIIKDENLAKILHKVPVGTEVPENLYKAVAAIFSFIYNLENGLK